MNTYSFEISPQKLKQLYLKLADDVYSTNDIIERQYRLDGCVITVYKSHKVVLQGKDAESYYQLLGCDNHSSFVVQAGSDEVGTGDFFGPICVCACYIDEQTNQFLSSMHFDDSKKLSDEYILSIIPKVLDKVPHSLLILDNDNYNRVIRDNNMNVIKAKMHNKCYCNLIEKHHIALPELVVIDDFCGEDKYYQYIASEKNVIHGITFRTKAESQYISVAIASMICRYAFLQAIDSYSHKYNIKFVKGAGAPADNFAKEFVALYGKEELVHVAKTNFKNMEKI